MRWGRGVVVGALLVLALIHPATSTVNQIRGLVGRVGALALLCNGRNTFTSSHCAGARLEAEQAEPCEGPAALPALPAWPNLLELWRREETQLQCSQTLLQASPSSKTLIQAASTRTETLVQAASTSKETLQETS